MQNDNSNTEHLDDCHPTPPATHHIFIAGTGRAGTSFLVQYLNACGLETTLALHPDGKLDEHANAGLEDYPTKGARLPYVMKSPWLYEFVDEMLARDDLVIDAVIMPMRDIVEAAASRSILEMGARFRDERVADDIRHWETWGSTPGGVVFSLNPIDQARILALGFHETIRALVKKKIPILFVDFPTMIQDSEYLWSALEPLLKTHTEREDALSAHARTADVSKVRVGVDLTAPAPKEDGAATMSRSPHHIAYPSHATLDRAALLREMANARKDLARLEEELDLTRQKYQQNESDKSLLHAEIDRLTKTGAQSEAEWNHERAQINDQHAAELTAQALEISNSSQRCREVENIHATQVTELETTISAITASTCWRITRPLRIVSSIFVNKRG
jgi:hypothetical protein